MMTEAFVLRDVDVQGSSYALSRPGAAPVAPASHPVAQGQQVPAPATAPTFEEQLALRYQDGLRAGRAAQAEAAALEHEAALDAERRNALAQAAEEGYAQGRAKAAEEARLADADAARQLEQQVKALEALARSIGEQTAAALEGVEDELVALCHDIVCRVLGDSVVTSQGIRGLVEQGLQALPGQVQSIHMHPDDLALCKASGALATPGVRWVADSSLALGGALLKSDQGHLDARLETQLKTFAQRLVAARAARGMQGPGS